MRVSKKIYATQTTYQPINTVSTNIHSELPTDQLPGAVRSIVDQTENTARDAADEDSFSAYEAINGAKDAAKRATELTKDMYHSAALKAEETLMTSKEYVRRNPIPVALGAIAFGAAVGYLLVTARRKPTFSERYVDEPLDGVRKAMLAALSPVTHGIHKGYDTARDGAEKALDGAHRFNSKRAVHSFSDRIASIAENLKFW